MMASSLRIETVMIHSWLAKLLHSMNEQYWAHVVGPGVVTKSDLDS